MTVHAAKGLEFPVVILADMTANIAARDPDRYLDPARKLCAMRLMWCAPKDLADHNAQEHAREAAEGVRVAYVAATRARDLLVVPTLSEGPLPGVWLSPLDKAIYNDTTKWWDLDTLKLNVDAKLGLNDYEILTGDSHESTEAYESWRAERAQALEQGSTPSFEIANPTDMPDAPAGIAVELVNTAHPDRPFGPRFGSLVHLLLRDFVGDSATASVHGRTLGAADEEIEAAASAARMALEHPLIMRARAASRCLREVPVSLRLDHDHSMEGSIDLAFEEDGTWHVVDYKTDSPSGARLKKYERQVAWYGAALARITGQPVRCHLMSV
jgi:ATP-dependent helicase/nuclease subunit A